MKYVFHCRVVVVVVVVVDVVVLDLVVPFFEQLPWPSHASLLKLIPVTISPHGQDMSRHNSLKDFVCCESRHEQERLPWPTHVPIF